MLIFARDYNAVRVGLRRGKEGESSGIGGLATLLTIIREDFTTDGTDDTDVGREASPRRPRAGRLGEPSLPVNSLSVKSVKSVVPFSLVAAGRAGRFEPFRGKWFFAVFSGMQATVWSGVRMCQAIRDNPKGIESISPGLRGMSYPGGMTEKSQTLQAEIFKLKIIGHLPAVPIGATHLKRKSSLKL